MTKRDKIILTIVCCLSMIGIINVFVQQPNMLVYPIVIGGIVLYAYKYSKKPKVTIVRNKKNTPPKKKVTFHVINGNKNASDDDFIKYQ